MEPHNVIRTKIELIQQLFVLGEKSEIVNAHFVLQIK